MTRSNTFKCMKGHRLTPSNTLWATNRHGNKVKRCRTCKNIRAQERYRERREIELARMNDAHRRWLARQPLLDPDDPKHGTIAGYNNHRCRCQPCRDAITAYHRARKAEIRRREEVAMLASIPERRGEARWSLDALNDSRFGQGVSLSGEWDDPVADLALELVGG